MAADISNNPFIILGHGTEDITKWVERPIIPKGITLITIAECGIVTTSDEVCPMVEAFSKEKNRSIFMNPLENRHKIENFMKGKGIHIYTEGKRYPALTLQMFLDWPSDDYIKIFKSGVYSFPVNTDSFQIGEGDTFCDKLFKKIGPYKGYLATIPTDYDPKIHFEGSIIPTVDEVSEIIKSTKKSGTIKSKLMIPLEDIFKKCGPGIYYYVICRSPKDIKGPENLFEMNVIPSKSINKYKPYLIKNWSSKVNNIIPLLEENIEHTKGWVKNELKSTRNEYKKLSSVPLIRRLSLTQQNTLKNTKRNTKRNIKYRNNTRKINRPIQYISHIKYPKIIKHIKNNKIS